jgi:hypothetical protein
MTFIEKNLEPFSHLDVNIYTIVDTGAGERKFFSKFS